LGGSEQQRNACHATTASRYGEYLLSVNGLLVFEPYQHTHVIHQPRQTVEIVLTTAPDAPEGAVVSLNLTSADPDAASAMPEGSTYTIASVDNPTFTLVGEFTGEGLNLPVSVILDQPLPYGDYVVTIDATPAFDLFVGEFTASPDPLAATKRGFFAQAVATVPFDILLVPAAGAGPAPTQPATPTVVTKLPSTGQGARQVDGANVAFLLAVACVLMASAVGVWLRSLRA
jgi:hypothetical protein